ncbi:hypothetical protein J437_LFUL000261 [Ladona fulva]|uniref:Uncharacterized protein n=1 Tax=Ladona fulva TaxID=123851 RepID=A0A8K0NV13_LADFU|nr:hypothetical protein J437_LFUL000261 [Ladona fulva]
MLTCRGADVRRFGRKMVIAYCKIEQTAKAFANGEFTPGTGAVIETQPTTVGQGKRVVEIFQN